MCLRALPPPVSIGILSPWSSYKGLVMEEAVIIIILEISEDATKSPQWPQK